MMPSMSTPLAKWVVRNKIRMILGKGIDWSTRL